MPMKLACHFNRTLDQKLLRGKDATSDDSSKRVAAFISAGPRSFSAERMSPIAYAGHVRRTHGPEGIRHEIVERSPLSNQGRLGSCTANRRADAYELVQPPNNVTQVSRLGLYWLSRYELHTECEDAGSFSHISQAVSEEYGLCKESIWPYDDTPPPSDEDPNGDPDAPMLKRPPLLAYMDMHDHKVASGSVQAIRRSGKARVQAMLDGLDLGFPVGVDSSIGQEFEDAGKDDIVGKPTIIIGGHAFLIVGYWIKSNGEIAFRVRNSWGEDWADNGHIWVSADYMADPDLTEDVDVTTSSPIWMP